MEKQPICYYATLNNQFNTLIMEVDREIGPTPVLWETKDEINSFLIVNRIKPEEVNIHSIYTEDELVEFINKSRLEFEEEAKNTDKPFGILKNSNPHPRLH